MDTTFAPTVVGTAYENLKDTPVWFHTKYAPVRLKPDVLKILRNVAFVNKTTELLASWALPKENEPSVEPVGCCSNDRRRVAGFEVTSVDVTLELAVAKSPCVI